MILKWIFSEVSNSKIERYLIEYGTFIKCKARRFYSGYDIIKATMSLKSDGSAGAVQSLGQA